MYEFDLNKLVDEKEPIQNLDYHLSLEGRIANSCYRNLYNNWLENIADLLRIADPKRIGKSVVYYKKKRDEAKPLQTKIYYHNQIVKIFRSAYRLISLLGEKDEEYLGLNRNDIQELILKYKDEYELDTYKEKLLNH